MFYFSFCPLGGASRCWAPHSLCLELWSKGLPTHQNIHSKGEQSSAIWIKCICNISGKYKSDLPYQDIDSQLRTAAEAFLENDDSCLVDSGKREVRLSQIFKWYKADFGGTDEKVHLTPNWPLRSLFFKNWNHRSGGRNIEILFTSSSRNT